MAQEAWVYRRSAPHFVVRVLMNAVGLWIAARLSRHIDYQDDLLVILIAALIFSVINAIIKPLVIFLALPAIILTLGLFMFVVNGLMVWLVSALYPSFEVTTFGAAVIAAIIIWIVNYGLTTLFSGQSLVSQKGRR